MSLFSFCFAKFPLWTLHVHRLLSGWKKPNLSKSHQICTEIADPSPTLPGTWSKNFVTSRGEVQGQGLPSPRWTVPNWSQVTSFARICPNSISTFRSFIQLGVGATHIHIQIHITNTEVVLMLGQVLVFTLHMFEPLRLGQVQNQKSQQPPRVHHTYTAPSIT